LKKLIVPVLICGAAGALFVALMSAAGSMAGAAANETPAVRLIAAANDVLFPTQIGELFKLGDDEFLVHTGPGVSLVPTATSTVRKIGYGESRLVTISTTSSGVYSSDGLASPNIRYPGIEVQPALDSTAADIADAVDSLAAWSPRHGWVPTPLVDAGSFAIISRDGEVTILTTPAGSCVMGPSIAIC
jgi:hypothetical protein